MDLSLFFSENSYWIYECRHFLTDEEFGMYVRGLLDYLFYGKHPEMENKVVKGVLNMVIEKLCCDGWDMYSEE